MEPLFQSKVAIVTGGASGIGRAAAMRFAEEGASVLIADLDEASGMNVVAQIRRSGGTASFHRTDVTKAADNEAMVVCALDRYGRLDVALNNAGTSGKFTDAVNCGEDEWSSVMDINAKSVWLAMKYEIPAMRRSGGGAIVNTASASTQRIQRGMYLAQFDAGLMPGGPIDNERIACADWGFSADGLYTLAFPGSGLSLPKQVLDPEQLYLVQIQMSVITPFDAAGELMAGEILYMSSPLAIEPTDRDAIARLLGWNPRTYQR